MYRFSPCRGTSYSARPARLLASSPPATPRCRRIESWQQLVAGTVVRGHGSPMACVSGRCHAADHVSTTLRRQHTTVLSNTPPDLPSRLRPGPVSSLRPDLDRWERDVRIDRNSPTPRLHSPMPCYSTSTSMPNPPNGFPPHTLAS